MLADLPSLESASTTSDSEKTASLHAERSECRRSVQLPATPHAPATEAQHDAAARRTLHGIGTMLSDALRGASSTGRWRPENTGEASATVPLAWLQSIEAGVRLLQSAAARENELQVQLAQLRLRANAADEELARRQAQLHALEDELGFAEAREASLCERLLREAEGSGMRVGAHHGAPPLEVLILHEEAGAEAAADEDDREYDEEREVVLEDHDDEEEADTDEGAEAASSGGVE